ncbi:MAG: sialidase family protein [Gemmatimonadota bacterium]|jgi:hypothetical protein
MRRLLSLASVLLVFGCSGDGRPSLRVTRLDVPAGEGSGEPFVSSLEDAVLLSWLERAPGGGHDLWVSRLGPDGWEGRQRVAHSERFFVNWADFPSVSRGGDGALWAHWLERREGPGLAYDVRVARSEDAARTWSPAWTPHEDGTPTEHGFVTVFPRDAGVGLVWLDGRGYAPGPDGSEPPREMSLRFREAAAATPGTGAAPRVIGAAGPETLLDGRTCDCCQTDVALTPEGPLVVYRNRTEEEIRDIYISRWTEGAWSEGVPVHDDGWVMAGCPVNGPAVDAREGRVGVAWFTGAGDTPAVYVAFSTDAGETFGDPVRLDRGNPAGRVDLRLREDGRAVVSWLERTQGGAELRVAVADEGGRPGRDAVVASASAARASGFPRMALAPWDPSAVILAWTDVLEGDVTRVHAARIEFEMEMDR